MLLRASDILQNRLRCDGLGGGSHDKKSVTLLNESIVAKGMLLTSFVTKARIGRYSVNYLKARWITHATYTYMYWHECGLHRSMQNERMS